MAVWALAPPAAPARRAGRAASAFFSGGLDEESDYWEDDDALGTRRGKGTLHAMNITLATDPP